MSGAEALQMVLLFLFLTGVWSLTQRRKKNEQDQDVH